MMVAVVPKGLEVSEAWSPHNAGLPVMPGLRAWSVCWGVRGTRSAGPKGLATLDAFASRHGNDPFRQFVKLSVNKWSRPYWMRYGYVTVNALRHVTDTSISAKSMCVENRIDASSSSVFCIFLPRTLKSHLVPTLEAWQAVAKALDLKI